MQQMRAGDFFGCTNQTLTLDQITLTDTEYTLDHVDWHYHEKPYLTFLLAGKLLEVDRQKIHHCTAGTLLFHDWEEPHYNTKPKGYARGFHIELDKSWMDEQLTQGSAARRGSHRLDDPRLTGLMYQIYGEMKTDSVASHLSIPALLMELLDTASAPYRKHASACPAWVAKIRDLLHDDPTEPWTLDRLAAQVQIHPVHLCRAFRQYFHCGLGDYLRLLKVQRASAMLADARQTLGAIAAACGFADQSHFIRTFRRQYGMPPLAYRRLLAR